MTNDYQLIDAEEQHRAHPDTFELPEAEWFEVIDAEWFIKIGVSNGVRGGERFWCRIVEVTRDGFVVRVQEPDMIWSELHGIEDGDVLAVERRHIMGVRPPELDARVPAWVQ